MPQSARTPTPSRPQAPRPLRFRVFAAAGNRFALLDATAHSFADPARLARQLCSPPASSAARPLERAPQGAAGDGAAGAALDGVLFVLPPQTGGTCRMLLHNADGGRAEACGNGLRCVALFAHLAGLTRGPSVPVETDCGTRTVEFLGLDRASAPDAPAALGTLELPPSTPTLARASMGVGRILERAVELDHTGGTVRATTVDMGNPHCVLVVPDVDAACVQQLGAELELHPHFPARTNVEFVARAERALHMRVWERGVGETGACGTGACAAALAVHDVDEPFKIEVVSPGGRLTVERDEQRELWLTGPCEVLAWVEVPEAME